MSVTNEIGVIPDVCRTYTNCFKSLASSYLCIEKFNEKETFKKRLFGFYEKQKQYEVDNKKSICQGDQCLRMDTKQTSREKRSRSVIQENATRNRCKENTYIALLAS